MESADDFHADFKPREQRFVSRQTPRTFIRRVIRASEVSVPVPSAARRDGTRRDETEYSNIRKLRAKPSARCSENAAPKGRVTSRRDALRPVSSSGCSLSVSANETDDGKEGGTLSPVKLRNIPREILQPVRRAEVRASSPQRCAEAARTTKIDDGGLRLPDTVPHLLIRRINQRFHSAASHRHLLLLFSPLFSLFRLRG